MKTLGILTLRFAQINEKMREDKEFHNYTLRYVSLKILLLLAITVQNTRDIEAKRTSSNSKISKQSKYFQFLVRCCTRLYVVLVI
jgi:hypothetical protein